MTTWSELEGIMLSEISQRQRQIPYDLTYNVKSEKVKLIETESRVMVARGWKVAEVGPWQQTFS